MKNIKKLDEYLDEVSEAFDNPLPIKWVYKRHINRIIYN